MHVIELEIELSSNPDSLLMNQQSVVSLSVALTGGWRDWETLQTACGWHPGSQTSSFWKSWGKSACWWRRSRSAETKHQSHNWDWIYPLTLHYLFLYVFYSCPSGLALYSLHFFSSELKRPFGWEVKHLQETQASPVASEQLLQIPWPMTKNLHR